MPSGVYSQLLFILTNQNKVFQAPDPIEPIREQEMRKCFVDSLFLCCPSSVWKYFINLS